MFLVETHFILRLLIIDGGDYLHTIDKRNRKLKVGQFPTFISIFCIFFWLYKDINIQEVILFPSSFPFLVYYLAVSFSMMLPFQITLLKWMEYLCDFLEMVEIPELCTHISTIKRGHYGLLDAYAKLVILYELVN